MSTNLGAIQSAPDIRSLKIELLELAYKVFHDGCIIKNQTEFSSLVLKMKSDYFSCIRMGSKTPNTYLFERILHVAKFYHRGFERSIHFGKPHAKHINTGHRRLEALINTIEDGLFSPACRKN